MQGNDDAASMRNARDPDWPAQHPALDAALAAAIRAPAVDARFDREVWARIRREDSAALAAARYRSIGPPFWLTALNAVAIGAAAFTLALALGMAARPIASSARIALESIEPSPRSIVAAVLAASAIGLWLGLRQTTLSRAVARWL